MTYLQQRKITIVLLILYWPALIVLAHMPIPQSVQNAEVSDKSLHFLAYLILVFLLWFSVTPNEKVKWHKIPVWIIFFMIAGYGAIDEIVQSVVGRNCDILDIAANIAGILTGLFIFTFITFWPAALIVTATVIFGMTNITRQNMAEVLPVINIVFHLCAYMVFTVLWIVNLHLLNYKKTPFYRWLIFAMIVPFGFFLIVKLSSLVLNRNIGLLDVIVPLLSITLVFAAFFCHALYRKTLDKKSSH